MVGQLNTSLEVTNQSDLGAVISKVEDSVDKQIAEITQRIGNLEEDMAKQTSKLKPDAYYEDLVTGIVTSITERQVENLQTELQTIKQLDNRVEEVIKVNGRIAKIE